MVIYKEMLTFAKKLDYLFKTVLSDDGKEYTCQQVAKGTGGNISAPYVWHLRKGSKSNPSKDHVLALSHFFKVPVNYFFEQIETKPELSPDLKQKLGETQTWILDLGGVLYDERFPIVSGLVRLLAYTEIFKEGITLPEILISLADEKIDELFAKKNVSERKRNNFWEAWPIFVMSHPLGSLFPEAQHLLPQLKGKVIFLTGIPSSKSKFIIKDLYDVSKPISAETTFLSLDFNPLPIDKMLHDYVNELLLKAVKQSSKPIVFVDDDETNLSMAKAIDPNITCVGMTSGVNSLIRDPESHQEMLKEAGCDVVFGSLFELREVLS